MRFQSIYMLRKDQSGQVIQRRMPQSSGVHAEDFEHESWLQTFLDNYRTWAAVQILRDHTEEFQFS